MLKKYRYKSSKDNGIQSLSKEKIEELRKYFESRKYTISSLNPISVKEYTQKIDEYLQSHFKYFRRGGKIIITGIRFKFKKDLNPYDIPYFKKNPIEKGIDYLLATDISELEGLDDYHKSFFYDSNKLRVIKYFLKLLVDLGNAWSSDEYYNIVKNYYMDADKKVPSQDSVRKYKGNVYQKFLSKIAGETAAKNIKFSNKELKEKLINLLRIPDKTINNYLRYSDKSLKAREILENLDNFIEEEVNKENNEALEAWKKELEDSGYFEGPLYAHKEFKGKSLKEVYKDIF